MKDHIGPRGRGEQKQVGVRELKTHAARIVREVREAQASYLVTHRGRAVGLILPLGAPAAPAIAPDDVSATTAWDAFLRAGRRLERRFRPGVSGVRALARMRR
jgi:antitoxin (DNA-binding transcriptional repressor) of toxin-antitoxin stability system